MKTNVIIGMHAGMIEDVFVIEDPKEAMEKEAERYTKNGNRP